MGNSSAVACTGELASAKTGVPSTPTMLSPPLESPTSKAASPAATKKTRSNSLISVQPWWLGSARVHVLQSDSKKFGQDEQDDMMDGMKLTRANAAAMRSCRFSL